ncbi:MAG TPA: nitroreductase family protein [Anaerolineaceae bacterium]
MDSFSGIDLFLKRRSIRRFSDQPVEIEKIQALLEAAMAAPTATNSQPWEFIVITEPETLKALRSKMVFGRYSAPLVICVCGSPGKANNLAVGRMFWEQDCSAATENILLAAVSLGLGGVWVGVHPVTPFVAAVRSVLNIPGSVIPLCLVYLGYPAEQKPARTQYDEHRVHWQVYEVDKSRAKNKTINQM